MNAAIVKDPHRTHEPAGLRPALLWIVLAGLVLLVGGALAVAWLTVLSVTGRNLTIAAQSPVFVGPGVEANQSLERHRMQHAQREVLESYGWTDQETGIARVPIGRAMEMMTPQHLAGLGTKPGVGSKMEEGGSRTGGDPRSSIFPTRPPVEAEKEGRP